MMRVKVYKIVRVDDNDENWYDTAIQLATEDVSDFDAEFLSLDVSDFDEENK